MFASSRWCLRLSWLQAASLFTLLALSACERGPQGEQGPQGPPGTQGPEGQRTLTRVSSEPEGANCPTGGAKIESGRDADGDGNLGSSEVDAAQTRYICNGAQGPQGGPGTLGTYGDGSASAYTVPSGSTVDLNTPAGLATLPAGFNTQFTNIVIDGTLIVPSGMELKATNDIIVRGTLIVSPGTTDSGYGEAQPGVARASAGTLSGGIGLSALQSAQVTRPGAAAGGAGARVVAASGGEGGGAVLLVARRNVQVTSTGRIEANGRNGVSGNDVLGAGGGAGGIIVIAAKGTLSVAGQLFANGGSGAKATSISGNGEGGGGGGGGGIIHLIASAAPTITGTLQVNGGAAGSNSATGTTINPGGGGGACGGNGGTGGGKFDLSAPLLTPTAGDPGHILQTVTPEPEYLLIK